MGSAFFVPFVSYYGKHKDIFPVGLSGTLETNLQLFKGPWLTSQLEKWIRWILDLVKS